MNLEEKLFEEMKQAMKTNDKIRLSTIRMIRSSSKNKEIELRRKLEDEDIFKVIQGMVRKGEESVEQFQAGGRNDLVEKEKMEIEILKSFLPQPIPQEEIIKIIDETIQETQSSSLKDLGKVMKAVMPRLGGKADGKVINQLVKERLSP
ncbi:MAG: GatB/YqeY domain-containing protein [Desulfobacterales bacterium]|nr:GatB/YqeY domain-containing protein [Desulfobacterales bacterium]